MEKAFSTHWNSSVQPRKQRKYRHNAPLHIKSKFLAAHLSKELRGKYSTRSIRVRSGDEVKVMRGQFAGKTGKVERVDTIHTKIFVTGVESVKRDGTKKLYPLQPSNVLITKVTDDKRRFPVAQKTRTAGTPNVPKKADKPAAKTPSKTTASKAKVKA
jgi:large subunit ribosomal protein L24